MIIRMLLAIPAIEEMALIHSILDSALDLTCLDVATAEVHNRDELIARIGEDQDDVVLLDWDIAQEQTPNLVSELLILNRRLRIVALLPLSHRQYRQSVWDAGACNGIPREHMDQEWLSTVLCLMYRAMQREQRILAAREKDVVHG
jgi:DNA-binding NarL/FixJ family response regulator